MTHQAFFRAVGIVAALLCALQPAHADQIRLRLNQVQVEHVRERDGDRPYFVTIVFRSKIGRRGNPTVTVMEREPHDWVSKREFNLGRLGGADHMRAGGTVRPTGQVIADGDEPQIQSKARFAFSLFQLIA